MPAIHTPAAAVAHLDSPTRLALALPVDRKLDLMVQLANDPLLVDLYLSDAIVAGCEAARDELNGAEDAPALGLAA